MTVREKRMAAAHERAIRRYAALLRRNWTPKTQEMTTREHRFGPDEEYTFTLYFDEQDGKWTTEELAFQAHLLRKITTMLYETKKRRNNRPK